MCQARVRYPSPEPRINKKDKAPLHPKFSPVDLVCAVVSLLHSYFVPIIIHLEGHQHIRYTCRTRCHPLDRGVGLLGNILNLIRRRRLLVLHQASLLFFHEGLLGDSLVRLRVRARMMAAVAALTGATEEGAPQGDDDGSDEHSEAA